MCGEGGEYETLTLDCPLFHRARIVLDSWQLVLHSADNVAPVGVLHPTDFHLESKSTEDLADMKGHIIDVPEGASVKTLRATIQNQTCQPHFEQQLRQRI